MIWNDLEWSDEEDCSSSKIAPTISWMKRFAKCTQGITQFIKIRMWKKMVKNGTIVFG